MTDVHVMRALIELLSAVRDLRDLVAELNPGASEQIAYVDVALKQCNDAISKLSVTVDH